MVEGIRAHGKETKPVRRRICPALTLPYTAPAVQHPAVPAAVQALPQLVRLRGGQVGVQGVLALRQYGSTAGAIARTLRHLRERKTGEKGGA